MLRRSLSLILCSREWSAFSDRFFLPQESAANALIKRPDRYFLKTNDQMDWIDGDTSFRARDRVGLPPSWLKARSRNLQSDCAQPQAHSHMLIAPVPYACFAQR